MSAPARWSTSGTSGQIFSYNGERLFYVTMVDGWDDQKAPTVKRLLAALNATEDHCPSCCYMGADAPCDEHRKEKADANRK